MASKGWTLRSGGAKGADSAFERGVDLINGKKQIFLPFPNYNGSNAPFAEIPQKAYQLIDDMWDDVKFRSATVRAMFARNAQQILGTNLDEPAEVVICWTPGGKVVGGTGRSIQIAKKFDIPVVNLFHTIDNETLFNMI